VPALISFPGSFWSLGTFAVFSLTVEMAHGGDFLYLWLVSIVSLELVKTPNGARLVST